MWQAEEAIHHTFLVNVQSHVWSGSPSWPFSQKSGGARLSLETKLDLASAYYLHAPVDDIELSVDSARLNFCGDFCHCRGTA